MSKISLARKVLPQAFRDALDRIVDRKGLLAKKDSRNVSTLTKKARKEILMRCFAEIRKLGFKLNNPVNLRTVHVIALVRYWEENKKGASTIQNGLSTLRLFCSWINKDGMIEESANYVRNKDSVRRSGIAKVNKAWDAHDVDPDQIVELAKEEDERVAVYLALMRDFGLRLQEAVRLIPKRCLQNEGQFILVRDGTKGGRPRMVPVKDEVQRETLAWATRVADGRTGRIHIRQRTVKAAYTHARYVMRKLGLTRSQLGVTPHGLRHGYAQKAYKEITLRDSPIAGGDPSQIDLESHKTAGWEVAERLGHSRDDVTHSYYGSYGHKLRPRKGEGPRAEQE